MGSAIDQAAAEDTGARIRTPYDPKLAQTMLDRIATAGTPSGAETLKALRSAFPDSPLSLRVAALNQLTRR